jgi:hypothetical protein
VVLYKFYIRQAKDAEWDEPVLLTLHGDRRTAQRPVIQPGTWLRPCLACWLDWVGGTRSCLRCLYVVRAGNALDGSHFGAHTAAILP